MRAIPVGVKLIVLVTMVMVLAFAVACGGSSGDTSTTATTTTTATQTQQQPAAPAAAPTAAGIFAAPAQPSAAAMPVGDSPTVPGTGPVQAKITRVVIGLEPESQEHNTPGRLGPPTNTQNNPMYEYLIWHGPGDGRLGAGIGDGMEH